jgi:1-acyl-sn-glycerol-3-phosphate acyltransferase
MSENVAEQAPSNREIIEWSYAPPPTVYDSVRDSSLVRWGREVLHSFIRRFIRSYNRLSVAGADNVADNWPCIITPNHSSHLDTLAVFSALPKNCVNRVCVLAAKGYFFKNGTMALGARLVANVIPIDRVQTEKRGLLICLSKLREGRSVLMFPEGTRDTAGGGDFKEGAVTISRLSKIPIIPTYIHGTGESLPKSHRWPKRIPIRVSFGQPVRYWETPFEEVPSLDAACDLKQRVEKLKKAVDQEVP